MKIKQIIFGIVRWLPTLMGLAFIGVVKLNHAMFRLTDGIITARDCIGFELLTLLLCGIVLLAQPVIAIVWIVKKRWRYLTEGVISTITFFPLFNNGIECGAAIMYAT